MRGEDQSRRQGVQRRKPLKKQIAKNVVREARGAHPKNTPDGSLARGAGPIFREDGGAVIDKADGGGIVARLKGGRVKKQLGGATIAGGGKKPSMGRAGRARGGGVGADLHPKTHDAGAEARKAASLMPESEAEPVIRRKTPKRLLLSNRRPAFPGGLVSEVATSSWVAIFFKAERAMPIRHARMTSST